MQNWSLIIAIILFRINEFKCRHSWVMVGFCLPPMDDHGLEWDPISICIDDNPTSPLYCVYDYYLTCGWDQNKKRRTQSMIRFPWNFEYLIWGSSVINWAIINIDWRQKMMLSCDLACPKRLPGHVSMMIVLLQFECPHSLIIE